MEKPKRSCSAEPASAYEKQNIEEHENKLEKAKRENQRQEIFEGKGVLCQGRALPHGPARPQERAVPGKDVWQAKLS